MDEHCLLGVELFDRLDDVPVLGLDEFLVGISLAIPREEQSVLSKDEEEVIEVVVVADW